MLVNLVILVSSTSVMKGLSLEPNKLQASAVLCSANTGGTLYYASLLSKEFTKIIRAKEIIKNNTITVSL